MDSKKIDKETNPVAYIRERFFEKLRNWRPGPELIEATRQRSPAEEKKYRDKIAKKKKLTEE